jgi:hypothetical protein
MKKISVLFVAVALLSLVASCVMTDRGPVYPEVSDNYQRDIFQERIDTQQKRINYNIESGELTRKEAGMLQDNLNWIRDKYSRMKADGILTQNEQERLDKMLDQNSEMIKNKTHNPARQLYNSDVRDRIESQQKRIDKGIASGELTRHEADIVIGNLNHIRKKYDKMTIDGVLTMKELEKLDKMLDENSKMINRKENNRNYIIRQID